MSFQEPRSTIDAARLKEEFSRLPPSPRNRRIAWLNIGSSLMYCTAAVCGWKVGEWWGLGLVLTLYLAVNINDAIHAEHREEVHDMYGNLAVDIAERSDILDHKVPKQRTGEQ